MNAHGFGHRTEHVVVCCGKKTKKQLESQRTRCHKCGKVYNELGNVVGIKSQAGAGRPRKVQSS